MNGVSSRAMAFRFCMGLLAASAIPAEAADVRQMQINPQAAATRAGMEINTNRSGSDYRSFDAPNAELCQTACTNETACRAWTWVKPGVQGQSGKCWLKNQAPPATASACCVSGVSQRGMASAQAQAQAQARAQAQTQAQARADAQASGQQLSNVAPGVKPLVPTRDTIKPISKPAQLLTGDPKTPGENRVYYYFREYDNAMKFLVQTSTAYRNKDAECRARGFTTREQVSAGCQPTDTVAQCSDKLIVWCTADARAPYDRSLAVVSAAASRLSQEAAEEAQTRANYQRMR